jgi:pectinesterase
LFVGCDIHGNVDFIFGNAKAVFVGCRLLVRRPSTLGGHNVITAQGRNNPDHDSGFVFINCSVTAAQGVNLTGVDTFLGRPWKNYSHVVFMDSFLDDILNAAGWVAWKKDQVVEDITKTVKYLEYKNRGPKANTAQRVKWGGFREISDAAEAEGYTVDRFIAGSQWVPHQLIHYNDTLPI